MHVQCPAPVLSALHWQPSFTHWRKHTTELTGAQGWPECVNSEQSDAASETANAPSSPPSPLVSGVVDDGQPTVTNRTPAAAAAAAK